MHAIKRAFEIRILVLFWSTIREQSHKWHFILDGADNNMRTMKSKNLCPMVSMVLIRGNSPV